MMEYTVRTTRRAYEIDADNDEAACRVAIEQLAVPRHELEEPERLVRVARLHTSKRYWEVLDVNAILPT